LRYQAKSHKHFKSSPGCSPQELGLPTAWLGLGAKKTSSPQTPKIGGFQILLNSMIKVINDILSSIRLLTLLLFLWPLALALALAHFDFISTFIF
jgi:hypothetical protein